MKNYEALYILDTKGKDDTVPDIADKISGEIKGLGGSVQGVQKLDRRKFERGHYGFDSGFYINILFSAPATVIEPLRTKLTLFPEVFRQMYLQVKSDKKAARPVKPKKAKADASA